MRRMTFALGAAALGLLSIGVAGAQSGSWYRDHSGNWYHRHYIRRYHIQNTYTVTNDMSNSTAVFVGGTPIMRFRVSAGGYTPQERAEETQLRLNRILGQGPIFPSDITVEPNGVDAVVLVKGQLLFTADAATADLNQSTPMELADRWANNMRSVLPDLTAPH